MTTDPSTLERQPAEFSRLRFLRRTALLVATILFLKVLISILLEYRWYFPANFDSAFLSGRRFTFVGAYRGAFYVHIISGPIALVLGLLLMNRRVRNRYRVLHRIAGRVQMLVVIAVLVPSGLVMASQAYAGPIAASGFTVLSLATATCASAALLSARAGRLQSHQKWATRCFLLLCSPLLLRLITGAAIVLELESDWSYRFNAWISWLIPLAIYEGWRRFSSGDVARKLSATSRRNPNLVQEATA